MNSRNDFGHGDSTINIVVIIIYYYDYYYYGEAGVNACMQLDEYQVPVSISLHLAGLQAQADCGNYDVNKPFRYIGLAECRVVSAAIQRLTVLPWVWGSPWI